MRMPTNWLHSTAYDNRCGWFEWCKGNLVKSIFKNGLPLFFGVLEKALGHHLYFLEPYEM
jgi:hypothetical protein